MFFYSKMYVFTTVHGMVYAMVSGVSVCPSRAGVRTKLLSRSVDGLPSAHPTLCSKTVPSMKSNCPTLRTWPIFLLLLPGTSLYTVAVVLNLVLPS